jgi:streptogramin lyase
VNVSTGTAPGASATEGADLPTAKMNTLADIVAACVNSSGSGVCDMLFTDSTPPAGSAPDNTLDAAVNIARNPCSHVAALYTIPAPASPFQPMLAAAPSDWTLAVTYGGGGLNTPGTIAVDALGNVWTANYFGSVTELSATGVPISPNAGFTGGSLYESYGLTVDANGSVWVTDEQTSGFNQGNGSLTVLNSSGDITSGSEGYFGGGVDFPVAIAADTDGSVWTANFGDSTTTKLSSAGSPISGSKGFGSPKLEGPVAIAIDAHHTAWLANYSADSGSVTSISSDGSQVNTITCCGEGPSGVATDAIGLAKNVSQGHVWTANYYTSTVSELELMNDGKVTVISTGYTGGGLKSPNGISIDGAGNVWVANLDGNTITELEGANGANPGAALSSSGGIGGDAKLSRPYGIAIDASGNVWVSNEGSSTITQFLGAAAPVKTPLLGPAQLP